jgi:exosome complex RNA-binding protein Rrp42 (RNase PH superfamily)
MSVTVDPQIIDALNQAQLATLSPQVVLTSGAGKAYQMVAQTSALAIQDAVDSLRNAGTLADAASAAALSQLMATGEPRYADVLKAAEQMRADAVNIFSARTKAAIAALNEFPAG